MNISFFRNITQASFSLSRYELDTGIIAVTHGHTAFTLEKALADD